MAKKLSKYSQSPVKNKILPKKIRKNIKTLHREMLTAIDTFNANIGKLRYAHFLETPYWKAVKKMKLKKQRVCERCGTDRMLQVHHKTYFHHYDEHKWLEDLEVLCNDCHKAKHEPVKKFKPLPSGRMSWKEFKTKK